jgi:hypothetical protein
MIVKDFARRARELADDIWAEAKERAGYQRFGDTARELKDASTMIHAAASKIEAFARENA